MYRFLLSTSFRHQVPMTITDLKYSVCVAVRNRWRVPLTNGAILELFRNSVASVCKLAASGYTMELIVADFGSTDANLRNSVAALMNEESVRMDLELLELPPPFIKGKGLLAACQAATGDLLLVIDADMLLSEELIQLAFEHCWLADRVLFPIAWTEEGSYEDRRSFYIVVGSGNVCYTRKRFNELVSKGALWDTSKTTWGEEDSRYEVQCARFVPIVRRAARTFVHQWHPRDLWGWEPAHGPIPA